MKWKIWDLNFEFKVKNSLKDRNMNIVSAKLLRRVKSEEKQMKNKTKCPKDTFLFIPEFFSFGNLHISSCKYVYLPVDLSV